MLSRVVIPPRVEHASNRPHVRCTPININTRLRTVNTRHHSAEPLDVSTNRRDVLYSASRDVLYSSRILSRYTPPSASMYYDQNNIVYRVSRNPWRHNTTVSWRVVIVYLLFVRVRVRDDLTTRMRTRDERDEHKNYNIIHPRLMSLLSIIKLISVTTVFYHTVLPRVLCD